MSTQERDSRYPLIREVSNDEFKREMGTMLLPAAKSARRGTGSRQTSFGESTQPNAYPDERGAGPFRAIAPSESDDAVDQRG